MNTIKWILFDVSGVVVPFNLINPEGYRVGTRFFEQKILEGFFYTKEYNNYMLGTLSHEQFIGKYLKRNKLDLSVEEFNELFQNDIKPTEGIVSLIKKLAEKYKIGLATNEGKLLTQYKIEKSEVLQYVSKIIASYRIRMLKPSKSFFKKTLEMIDTKPQDCIFIDDTQENVDAANTIGMKGILFTDVLKLEAELKKLNI